MLPSATERSRINIAERTGTSMAKEEPKIIGKIGSLNVADINGFVCLQCNGKRYIGIGKIKAVLANQVACKEFLAKYDVAKPAPAAAAAPANVDKDALAKKIADLEATLAKLTKPVTPQIPAAAESNGHGRFVPA